MRKLLKLALMCSPLVLPILTATPAAASKSKADIYRWKSTWYECCKTNADGSPFDANNPHTAAHKTLPFGTKLLLSYKGRSLCVTIRDRGPFKPGKELDVTRAAAKHLGFKEEGVAILQVVKNGC